MKIKRVVMLSDEHAVIHLQPSWLARLFGARDVVCELEYDYPHWVSKYSRERLGWMRHSSLLKYALECQPLQVDQHDDVPIARIHKEK